MLSYLKAYWKWMLAGAGVVVILAIALLAFRVSSFVGATTGGGRTAGYLASPTPDIAATVTAQTSFEELFGAVKAPAAPEITPTPVATAVPSYSNSTIVQKIKSGEPITTMLVGYGGNQHAGEWLTDTILLLRFDPKTNTVLQLNIPRDLYVYAPFGGKNNGSWLKINTILSSIMDWDKPTQDSLDPRYRWSDNSKKFDSGMNLLADTVELVVGFRIDYWGSLSFEGFRRFIDAMGGVNVNVERYFIDRKYPRNDNDQIDASFITIEYKPGWQRMNGETAIRYARSRNSETPQEGGDFARSRRQMNLIKAVKEQAFQQNLVLKSLDFMQALEGQIRFSLDFGELTALANYFNSAEGKEMATKTRFVSEILNDNYLVDTMQNGAYILLPREGQGKYSLIQRWLRFAVMNAGVKGEDVKLQVLNANGTPGIAGKVTDFLIAQGFTMLQEQDGENQEQTELIDYTQGKAPNTIARLKTYLPNLKVTQMSPDKKPKNAPPEVDLQLRLGKDFKPAQVASSSDAKP